MPQVKPKMFLAKKQRAIAAKVRALRLQRKWSQAELAKRLGLSQNRLSEIERGAGSFSAEQLLLLLALFNVSVSAFTDEVTEPDLALQNALARLGASHLHEADHVLPSEQLTEVGDVIREVLVSGARHARRNRDRVRSGESSILSRELPEFAVRGATRGDADRSGPDLNRHECQPICDFSTVHPVFDSQAMHLPTDRLDVVDQVIALALTRARRAVALSVSEPAS